MLCCCHDGRVEELAPRRPAAGEMVWLHLENPDDETVHAILGDLFACHPLVVEDILHFGQRAKLDHYAHLADPQVFTTFYALTEDMRAIEVAIVLSSQAFITVVREPLPLLNELYDRAKQEVQWFRSSAALLYRVLDACVDEYFTVVDRLEGQLDELEQRVFDHPEVRVAPEIFRLKRRLHYLRRLVADGRNVVGMIAHESFPFTDPAHQVYFVDVFDHASRVVDSLDAIRDALSGLLDLQTAQRANRMNEIMKTLTIFSTIFLPLSFIVGLYGMNFRDIPELNWPFGYAYVWALMLGVTAAMIVYFKRKGWW
ncbi:MAG: magnesium/cobalt transporter CorA [Alicyclobacillus sp.]|nr:magnesium/cobalt transporter CorA [Alicyclobacillus sp.]